MAATLSQQLAKEIVNSVHDILGHETFYAQGGTIYAGTDETRLGDYHLPAEARTSGLAGGSGFPARL